MTNKEAGQLLSSLRIIFGRRSGKTLLALRYSEAVSKSIKALEDHDRLREDSEKLKEIERIVYSERAADTKIDFIKDIFNGEADE